MSKHYLGVDIGNTKSHAVLCDAEGHVRAFAVGGPGNHESLGAEGFQQVLQGIVADALAQAKLTRGDIGGAGFGIAGYDWDEDTPMIDAVIGSLGLNAPYEAMNDAGPGLLAGARQGWGVSVSSGTGVNARGRAPDGRTARMTGNGMSFGEIGGSSELVQHVIGEISRAWSQRGRPTALSEAFVAFAGAKDVEDLLAGMARGRYRVRARAAPLVFEAARAGDAVAQDAVRWLGAGAGDLACGIIRQLGIEALEFDVVLSGTVFNVSPLMLDAMREVVLALAPCASFVHLSAPPVTGAVMLGMQVAGIDFLPLRERIIAETQARFDAHSQSA
jgi:N-acetylglucosamine kinase-like BadF-type ATPase